MPAIRLARPDDAAAIAALYRPYVEQTRISFEEEPPDADEIARRMAGPTHSWLVASDEFGRLLGYASCGAMRGRAAYRWSVETGVYVDPSAHRRGVGTLLLTAQLALLEEQGFASVVAGIALPNDASVRLHRKLGFTLIGIERGVGFKLGEWIDVGRWQRDLAPRTREPREPRPPA